MVGSESNERQRRETCRRGAPVAGKWVRICECRNRRSLLSPALACNTPTPPRLAVEGAFWSSPAKAEKVKALQLRVPMLRAAATGLIVAFLLLAQEKPAAKKPVTIDAVVNAPASPLGTITWAPDGERFIFTERGELTLYDIRSGKERSVIALDKLENAAVPARPAP